MAPIAARIKRSVRPYRRDVVPLGYEALADALDSDAPATEALLEIGRTTARDGASLDDVLDRLAQTYGGLLGEPPFDAVRTLAGSWADASLRYLHAVSCEDPLTGLASLEHVRTRIVEAYREAERAGSSTGPPRALLIIEIAWSDSQTRHFDQLLRLVDLVELVRSVYTGDETVGRLSSSRVAVVVHRDQQVGAPVAGLLGLLQAWEARSGPTTRLWLEGLPATAAGAEVLLDELAR